MALRLRRVMTSGVLAAFALAAAASGRARPFLFTCGRFAADWASRPWSYDQQCWDRMVDIGVTMTGCGVPWAAVEPSPGQYDWTYSDFQIDEIVARGMEPFVYLGDTPDWAKLYPDLPTHRTPPREDCADEFMAFHQMVAERYRGKVKYYVFWNEPNGCCWINDGCNNSDSYPLYTQWLIRCSQAIKAGDPDARVIGGNIDYHGGMDYGWQYIQGMYDCGAGPYIDGIAIHAYSSTGTLHWQAIEDTRAVMVANGDADKGIWVTEYGWNWGSEEELADKLAYVLEELKKPEWDYVVMANYLVLNDGPGVENYGLTDAELTPRLRYYTYQAADKAFAPEVDFTAKLRAGPTPLSVHFTDESYVPGEQTRLWSFGDGTTSTEENPTHVYTQAGVYTVSLTVTGEDGPVTEEKVDYVHAWAFPPEPGVDNPSFEVRGGSYDAWEIACAEGEGPDDPPLSNDNPYGLATPFGTHFAGRITDSWAAFDFTLGQLVEVSDYCPTSDRGEWSLSAYVQMHSDQGGYPMPDAVHQVWELGWKSDGSLPDSIDDCDNWIVLADVDGNYTGNDKYGFHPLQAGGVVSGVPGLRYVALRVHCYNTRQWQWGMCCLDNVQFDVQMQAASPAGLYKPGWNLTSVPVQPSEPEAVAVFGDLVALGNDLTNNLASYEPGGGYLVYPDGFAIVALGRAYWLHLTVAPPDAVVHVDGQKAAGDVHIPLSEGWNLVGHPHKTAVPWGDCTVTDGSGVKSVDEAAEAGWIESLIYYYEPGSGYRTVRADGTGDDYALRPWRGYWILAKRGGLELVVPVD